MILQKNNKHISDLDEITFKLKIIYEKNKANKANNYF